MSDLHLDVETRFRNRAIAAGARSPVVPLPSAPTSNVANANPYPAFGLCSGTPAPR